MCFINKQPTRSIRRRRGAATVEAAFVLPIVLLFLLGILEYGRYVMMLQVLTNASREGACYALTHTQPVTIAGVTYGNATTDVTNVINKALAGQHLTGQTVQIYASDTLGNNIGAWNNAQFGQSICVRITGTYTVLVGSIVRLPATFPVTSQVVMRAETN